MLHLPGFLFSKINVCLRNYTGVITVYNEGPVTHNKLYNWASRNCLYLRTLHLWCVFVFANYAGVNSQGVDMFVNVNALLETKLPSSVFRLCVFIYFLATDLALFWRTCWLILALYWKRNHVDWKKEMQVILVF